MPRTTSRARLAAGLGLLFAFGALSGAAYAQTATGEKEEKTGAKKDWVLAYVMSYDNNLERCGPIILDGLERGIQDTETVVTVLADFTDTKGLRRYTLTKSGREVETLATDNCASEEVMADYFDWVAKTHPAKRYGVVFLNHGGDLDAMCLDDRPGERGAKKWLSAKRMGPILRSFRKDAPGEVELLFLQQCGRGSIDNLYNFRGAGRWVMASQCTVGAPNTYYEATVRGLGENPEVSGKALADTIMAEDEHYTSYVCVDGEALNDLPDRIDPVVKALLQTRSKLTAPDGLRPCFGGFGDGETNFDLVAWLSACVRVSGDKESCQDALAALERWIGDDLIVSVKETGGPSAQRSRGWCGLSIYVPQSSAVRGRYADYPLYKESRLDDLMQKLYPKRRSRSRF